MAAMTAPEELYGDNMYHCPQCDQRRPALRYMVPSKVPPILQFALNRFVYDAKSGTRKKIKHSITYPKEICIAGKDYKLCGVITHQGSGVSGVSLTRLMEGSFWSFHL